MQQNPITYSAAIVLAKGMANGNLHLASWLRCQTGQCSKNTITCAGRAFAEHLLRLAGWRLLQQHEAHRSAYVSLYPITVNDYVQIHVD